MPYFFFILQTISEHTLNLQNTRPLPYNFYKLGPVVMNSTMTNTKLVTLRTWILIPQGLIRFCFHFTPKNVYLLIRSSMTIQLPRSFSQPDSLPPALNVQYSWSSQTYSTIFYYILQCNPDKKHTAWDREWACLYPRSKTWQYNK